MVFVIIFIWR